MAVRKPWAATVRSELGQGREVRLVPLGGAGETCGFRGDVMGDL